MPIIGRYSSLTITISIPSTPIWAHDVVLNASIAWNQAQAWYRTLPNDYAFSFVESSQASAVISFSMPQAYVGFAVGWTDYKFAPSSKYIVSSKTYLEPFVFNSAQENNGTARQYAFRLAVHELGRILGLGSVLDGKDVMDPRSTPARATEPVMFSTLDLYALEVLASANTPPVSVTLPGGVQNLTVNAGMMLSGQNPSPSPPQGSSRASRLFGTKTKVGSS